MFLVLQILSFVGLVSKVNGEVFSSIAIMEDVVEIQGQLLKLFDTYTAKQFEVLEEITRTTDMFRIEYAKARTDPAKYIGNPIDSYRLIKQLYVDWDEITNIMKTASEEFESEIANIRSNRIFPVHEDLVGSAEAILRLQHTYKLETRDVAEGILNGIKHSSPLTSHDCYLIGLYISETKSYNKALEWHNVAMEKFQEKNLVPFTKINILESIAYNKYMMGNIQDALDVYLDVQRLMPQHPDVKDNIEICQNALNNTEFMANLILPYVDPHTTKDDENYLQLCREAIDRSPSYKKRLKCYYSNSQSAFAKLAPFKVEEHFHKPDVFVFHDMIYDSEIEYIINEIKPKLQRAQVVNEDGTGKEDKVRISMNNWLYDDHSPIIKRINRRFHDMTGLNMELSEALQIADYGIGGYYGLHIDFSTKDTEEGEGVELKSRIATILVYMTDVEKGGNTVFPYLGVSVKPQKGSAVFWYNLHPSGEGYMGTWHAGCPVLIGNKWVANKWVRIQGNEFASPCNLEYQEEGHNKKYPDFVFTGL